MGTLSAVDLLMKLGCFVKGKQRQIDGYTDREIDRRTNKHIQWDWVLDKQIGKQTNIQIGRLAEECKDWLKNAWKDRQMDKQKDKYSN